MLQYLLLIMYLCPENLLVIQAVALEEHIVPSFDQVSKIAHNVGGLAANNSAVAGFTLANTSMLFKELTILTKITNAALKAVPVMRDCLKFGHRSSKTIICFRQRKILSYITNVLFIGCYIGS